MRIDVLVPVYVDMWNEGILKEAIKSKAPDVDLRVTNLDGGVPSMESAYDVAIGARLVVEKAQHLEKEGSQGIIIYCFKDPALEACKEKLDIPVVGLREASIALAGIIGDNIGVITSRSIRLLIILGLLRVRLKVLPVWEYLF
ncbi:MAG: aspartate/glutamate racemase family protein [Clostridia bacterium]